MKTVAGNSHRQCRVSSLSTLSLSLSLPLYCARARAGGGPRGWWRGTRTTASRAGSLSPPRDSQPGASDPRVLCVLLLRVNKQPCAMISDKGWLALGPTPPLPLQSAWSVFKCSSGVCIFFWLPIKYHKGYLTLALLFLFLSFEREPRKPAREQCVQRRERFSELLHEQRRGGRAPAPPVNRRN